MLSRLLAQRISQGKVPAALAGVGASCSSAKKQAEAADNFYEDGNIKLEKQDPLKCTRELNQYYMDMLWPYLSPGCFALALMALHCVCCVVSCCRWCRRCLCCKERYEPRKAPKWQVLLVVLLWVPVAATLLGVGATVEALAFTIHSHLDWHLCTVFQLVEEGIYGSEDFRFLGMYRASADLEGMAVSLDFDGSLTREVRSTLKETSGFIAQQAKLRQRLSHFEQVLRLSGPSVRVFEHRCVFCSLAVGDTSNVIPGYPEAGILPAMQAQFNASLAQSLVEIRADIEGVFAGDNLLDLASKIKEAIGAVQILDSAMRISLVDSWANFLPSIDAIEGIRIGLFVVLGFLAFGSALHGTYSLCVTKVRAKKNPERVPSGKVHCCSWCLFLFFAMTGALSTTGLAIIFTVFAGEGCIFMRQEIFTHTGIERYADLLGLVPVAGGGTAASMDVRQASSNSAINLARSCFAVNDTGDIMQALKLSGSFDFQPALLDSLYGLDALVARPPIGERTADYYDLLLDSASRFAGMFVLDPLGVANATSLEDKQAAIVTGRFGLAPLHPNSRSLLLGSTVVAERVTGPDNRLKEGLNSFASLIAGPGKYTFLHGTAGGGYVVTTNLPDTSELSTLDNATQNALLYARAKEHLLASSSSLRCDVLLDSGKIQVKKCGLSEFAKFVAKEVDLLKLEMDKTTQSTRAVQSQFLGQLRTDLIAVMRRIKELRTLSGCRFLWARVEAVDQALCEDLVPSAASSCMYLMILATAACIGTVVQYKVWRHLKDNKVVGAELERFQLTNGGIQVRIQQLEDEWRRRDDAERRSVEDFVVAEDVDDRPRLGL